VKLSILEKLQAYGLSKQKGICLLAGIIVGICVVWYPSWFVCHSTVDSSLCRLIWFEKWFVDVRRM